MIKAYEGRTIGVYVIPGAFLHAKQSDLTYVKMTDDTTKLLVGKFLQIHINTT
jgi:hypothetical protein